MLKVTLKGLAARKLRLALTSAAVLLGVAFMAGTFVLTDTIGQTFDDLFADVNEGTDAFVRSASSVESMEAGETRGRIDAALADVVAAVDGVAVAEPQVEGYAQIVGADGEAIGDFQGAPTYGGNWSDADGLNPFTLVDGRGPAKAGEVVIDKKSADDGQLRVGATTTVITQSGSTPVTVVGVVKFGTADSPAGASFALFTLDEAQRLIGEPGRADGIGVVAEDGVSETVLARRIAAAVPDGLEVLTGTQLAEENASSFKEGLEFFNIFMLLFAVVALFVGSFIIYNTFSILVVQRAKEMALLRAIGASRGQVLSSVLVEAVLVGLFASAVGVVAGVFVSQALQALLTAFGFEIPSSGTVVLPRTIVVSMITGLGISLVAAVFPARKAAKIPPIAAMRDVALNLTGSLRRRVVMGALLGVPGALLMASGLIAKSSTAISQVGLGAMLIFLATATLGPVVSRPFLTVVGRPLPAARGVVGRMAWENTLRNPRRTASTASALMIGVGLVGFMLVFATSAKRSVDSTVDNSFGGDLVVNANSFGFGGLPPELAQQLTGLPEVEAASPFRAAIAKVNDGGGTAIYAVDAKAFAKLYDVQPRDGRLEDLDATSISVHETVADEKGWAVGDTIQLTFAESGTKPFVIKMIHGEKQVSGNYLIDLTAYNANVPTQFDGLIWVKRASGSTIEETLAAVERVAAAYPTAEVQDRSQFKESVASQINRMLGLVTVMLLLAIVIALLGIANTLALSVIERTRELGLVRAVGMTREQLRSSIRWEALLIAVFGVFGGLFVAVLFGWAVITALESEGFNELVIPVGQLAVMALIGAVAGVVAAILPARRAARLDVLGAIATT